MTNRKTSVRPWPAALALACGGRWLLVFVFAILVPNAFSQDLDRISDQVSRGSVEQKRNALGEIRNLRSEKASRIAVQALNDTDELIRSTAINAVVFLPEAEVAAALIPLLNDKAEFVRREAAFALGEARSTSAVSQLKVVTLQDRAQIVRAAAVAALGKIGVESALDALASVLKRRPGSSDEYLRRVAARSIGQIAERSRFGIFSRSTPEDFLPGKYKAISSADKYPRASAAFQEPLRILLAVAANRKESDDTRREAAFALGAIGDPAAIPFLTANSASSDIYLAQICRDGLLKISKPE